ncbi:MAG: DUF5916 domain-containing protein [Longimicrobiales bacterium]|nr:DUF5916 domain-containing protein [Longimicrobiales bacterium]
MGVLLRAAGTRFPVWCAAAATALSLAAAVPLSAQAEGGGLRALRLEEGVDVRLDGRLSEAFWDRALPITDFTQQVPVEGAAPSRRTEVRVAYDADALYIGAVLHDDPEAILAYQKRRDQGLGTDDRFMWILDTFSDGRTGYFFEINANGLMGDGLMGGGGGGSGVTKSWDGIWEARVSRNPDGWSAEVRIPFGTLNFDPGADSWGINFQRTIRRHNEEILWRGWRQNQGLFNPVFAGRLEGLEELSQGVGLEVKPYVTQGWRDVRSEADPTSFPGDVGVDVTYSLTPGLRAAVSWNTDFAEVEVDQRRVNLTRFPLRFPEQRDFFLEGSGVFSFAPRSGPSPYFSRRIGLEGGEPVPIDFGGRLGGQAGPYEMGFLQVRTGGIEHAAAEDFTVARVKRRLFAQSSLGAMYTRRAGGGDGTVPAPEDRHTAGVDLDFKTAAFLGGSNLELEAFVVWNSDPEPGEGRSFGDLSARGFRLNFPNDVYQGHLSFREFGDAYDPAVGFVTRTNFRRVEPRVAWAPRPSGVAWLRQLEFSLQYRQLTNLETGVLEERTWDFGLLEVDFESGDNFEVQLTRQFEFLDRGFEVRDGFFIDPGAFTNWEATLRGGTASRRRVSLRGEAARGGFWDGDRFRYSVDLSVRPRPGYTVALDLERNEVSLPEGDFDTNLVRLNGGWDISPWASFTTNVQYDDVSEVLGYFGLLRWIIQPGNELFFVFTQNWQRGPSDTDPLDHRFRTLSRGSSLKVNYTWRW